MPKFSRHIKKKRRFLPFLSFMLVFTGTCLFLYFAHTPNLAGSAPLSGAARDFGEASNADLRAMAVEAKIEVHGNIISAAGTGRVTDSTVQAKLLARRAAITDARRNLLAYRQELIAAPSFRRPGTTVRVSGFLAGTQRIKSESVRNGIYHVELEMYMDDLLHSNFDENRFVSESDDL